MPTKSARSAHPLELFAVGRNYKTFRCIVPNAGPTARVLHLGSEVGGEVFLLSWLQ